MKQANSPGPPMRQPQEKHPMPIQRSCQKGDRVYSLVVEQQPDRARMCGFGDKDRRPITPPPCIKLIITDVNTGRQLSVGEIDSQKFVLNVEIMNEQGSQEVNMVKTANSSPSTSISMASPARYPANDEPGPYSRQPIYAPLNGMELGYYPHMESTGAVAPPGFYQPSQPVGHSNGTRGNNFNRNLIGSTTVSVAQLNDLEDTPGLWFVLQDLSVRQEGHFRLRLSFIDLSGSSPGDLNTGRNAVLASVFSDIFTVYSAKRFPGVKESTALSKCFAAQGVKIPIRKDGSKAGGQSSDE